MAVGDIAGNALLHCIGRKPQTVFSSTDQECRLMVGLSRDAAADIARANDWRALTKIHTFSAGISPQTLPTDYDRMVAGSRVGELFPVAGLDEWMHTDNPGWVILADGVHFRPPPTSPAKMAYVSCAWARRQNGNEANEFLFDNDEFVLPDHLLRLALIWRYKEATGLDYTEDMVNYETALAQAQGRDRGSYTVPVDASLRYDPRTYSGRVWR